MWQGSPILDDLRAAYQSGDLIVLAGPGTSTAAGLPPLRDLAAQMAARLRAEQADPGAVAEIDGLLRAGRVIDALAAAKGPLGGYELERAVEKALDDTGRDIPAVATAVAALAPRLRAVLTTNLDRLLERAFAGSWEAFASPTGSLAQKRRYILKLHGTLADRRTWVLTRGPYDRAMLGRPELRATFEALFRSFPILFVGCDLEDEDLDLTLSAVRALSEGQPPEHFALVPEPVPPYRRGMLQKAGLRLLTYENDDGQHRELVEMLRSLGSQPEQKSAAVTRIQVKGGSARFFVPFLRNKGFVGREEDLAEIHALLQEGQAVGVLPVAASGMGGIGKTQLAVEYAYRYAGEYPGGVFWVNAANDWLAELAALAERVGLREDDAPDSLRQQRLALAFAAYLREHPGALVIFDNVEDPLSLQDASLPVVPVALSCRLLFTTRRRDKDSPFANFEVRVLPEDFALQLLLSSEARRAVGSADLDVARDICRALGCLPLAIVLAASYLGKSLRVSLSDYLGRLQREGGLAAVDAAKVDKRKLATLHDAAVEATLAAQWEAVESEDARRVLKAAALLGEAAQVSRGTLSLLTGLSDMAAGGYMAPLEEALGERARCGGSSG